MKFDPVKGRIGRHRFHVMLVHFPSALYPFCLMMDVARWLTHDPSFSTAGLYALTAALAFSIPAMIYGAIDFLAIPSTTKAWTTAGIHALLNVVWFIVFSSLFIYRWKHTEAVSGWTYLSVEAIAVTGLLISNFMGGELIIKHKVGIDE